MGQLIAITVEKGMDWKQAVVPVSTKPTAAAKPAPPSGPTQPAAPSAGTLPPPSGQYVIYICTDLYPDKCITWLYYMVKYKKISSLIEYMA